MKLLLPGSILPITQPKITRDVIFLNDPENELDNILEIELLSLIFRCEENDKLLMMYALLKLNLIRGMTVIFVNTVDKCYR